MNDDVSLMDDVLLMDCAIDSSVQANDRNAVESPLEFPKLDAILQQIFRDASRDSLRYVLRSNVGHDGE